MEPPDVGCYDCRADERSLPALLSSPIAARVLPGGCGRALVLAGLTSASRLADRTLPCTIPGTDASCCRPRRSTLPDLLPNARSSAPGLDGFAARFRPTQRNVLSANLPGACARARTLPASGTRSRVK